jgi:hypothetical protein
MIDSSIIHSYRSTSHTGLSRNIRFLGKDSKTSLVATLPDLVEMLSRKMLRRRISHSVVTSLVALVFL